jgi:hypothetical protein
MFNRGLLILLFVSASCLSLRNYLTFKQKLAQVSFPASSSLISQSAIKQSGNHNVFNENNINNYRHKNKRGQLFSNKVARTQDTSLQASAASGYDYVAFTLDKSVLPRGGTNFGILYLMAGFLLGSTFFRLKAKLAGEGVSLTVPSMSDMIPRQLPTWSSRIADLLELGLSTVSDICDVVKAPFVQLLSFMGICCRVMWAKIALLLSNTFRTINNYMSFDPPDVLNVKDWRVCTIEEREVIGGNIVKYRLQLNNDNGIVPLTVGQEVSTVFMYILCSVQNNIRLTLFILPPPLK